MRCNKTSFLLIKMVFLWYATPGLMHLRTCPTIISISTSISVYCVQGLMLILPISPPINLQKQIKQKYRLFNLYHMGQSLRLANQVQQVWKSGWKRCKILLGMLKSTEVSKAGLQFPLLLSMIMRSDLLNWCQIPGMWIISYFNSNKQQ